MKKKGRDTIEGLKRAQEACKQASGEQKPVGQDPEKDGLKSEHSP